VSISVALAGYDPDTDRLVYERRVPDDLQVVFRWLIPVSSAPVDQPLSADEALAVATLFGWEIDRRLDYFLAASAQGSA